MARGRIINNGICGDKRINELSDDTSRLAFTWLVTFADREGRTYGDPAMVRSMLFPRRDDITIERMTDYLTEWAEKKLIIWYEADGDLWVWFPGFDKNQAGMNKSREAPSRIPEPPTDGYGKLPASLMTNSGVTHEQVMTNSGVTPGKSIEINRNHHVGDDFDPATTEEACRSVAGTWMNKTVIDQMNDLLSRRIPASMIYEAQMRTVEEAKKQGETGLGYPGKRQWGYVLKVLRTMEQERQRPRAPAYSGPSLDIVGWDGEAA